MRSILVDVEFWKYFFNTDFQNKEHFEYLDSSSATKLAPAAPVEVRGAPPARPRLPGAARLGRGRGLGPRPRSLTEPAGGNGGL